MSDKTETPAAEGADAAKPAKAKKGKGKLFAILGVVVLVLAGGGGTAFWMMRAPAEAAEAEPAEAHVDLAHAGIIKFEPFIVNLADPGAKRFLRVSIAIIVPSEDVAKEIEHGEVLRMQLRSEILDLLTTQTSEQIVTPDGKAALKKAILEKAHHTFAPHEAHDVIFSDFVVQY